MSFLMTFEENHLANQQARNFGDPKSAVEAEKEEHSLQWRSIFIQQPEFIKREGVNLHELPLLVAWSRIHSCFDFIKVLWLPPLEILALVEPT